MNSTEPTPRCVGLPPTWVGVSVALALAITALPARAESPSFLRSLTYHAELSAAHPLDAPKSDQFGWGASGLLAVEKPLGPVGVELPLGFVVLAPLDRLGAPLAPSSAGTAWTLLPGLRADLLSELTTSLPRSLWLAAGGGIALTGTLLRPAFDARLGLDLHFGRWALGPTLGYLQIVELAAGPSPEDARVFSVGIHGLLGPSLTSPPRPVGVVTDQDRMPNVRDICRDHPGGEGCPDADADGDGIPDKADACPQAAEDQDGFEDDDGCPDEDNDHDGINDLSDLCPLVPETFNGYNDGDGCPDEVKPAETAVNLPLGELIPFAFDDALLAPEQLPRVQAIAQLLLAHPEYLLARVTGYSDEVGSERYNADLSQRRAEGVKAELVKAGVVASRLVSEGRGKLVRKAGDTADRRRVEVHVTRRRQVPSSASPPGAKP